ncbi:MAG: hypothetical protein ACTSW7_00785 [Candidatus Thorarchaeota archaeon]|nr:hypothetical protein [Thermoplasmatales archaeon]
MREFTRAEVASGACWSWQERSKKLVDQLQRLKGRSKFTFFDVVTNLSIDKDEHDVVYSRMVRVFLLTGEDAAEFDEWLFGTDQFIGKVGEHQYREIIYTLIRSGIFEKLLDEFKKWREDV